MAARELFEDRTDAGLRLAERLETMPFTSKEKPLVIGLPRGGLVVAHEVARALHGELDVWGARKVLVPEHAELVLGAVAERGELVVEGESVRAARLTHDQVRRVLLARLRDLDRQCKRYRQGRATPDVSGRVVIVVDDGVANGATARAALRAIRRGGPAKLVFATPIGQDFAVRSLARESDDLVCLESVERLGAVGLWYREFRVVDDDALVGLLDPHARNGVRVIRVVREGDHWDIVEGRAHVIDAQPTKEEAIREARELAAGSGAVVLVQAGSGRLEREVFAY